MLGISPELAQLADVCGVLTSYEDVYKRRREASVESLLAVLQALGVDVPSMDDVPRALTLQRTARLERGIEPVLVAWDGEPVEFDLTLPARSARGAVDCCVESEDQHGRISQRIELDRSPPQHSACGRFVTRPLRLTHALDGGYHRLTIERSGPSPVNGFPAVSATLISAPRRAYAAESSVCDGWGCFLPLYALRSERNWGAGDFTDLQDLAAWTKGLGGSVVGTLPLLAAFLDEPFEPSPYAPASRLAWNEFYIDVARVAELDDCPQAAERLQSSEFLLEVTRARESELVDYRRIMSLKRQVLQMLAQAFFAQPRPERYAEFERFLNQHPHVEDYAEFRAAYQRRQEPWDRWPARMCAGRLSDDDYDQHSKQYHLYVQWIATAQLESLADSADGGLYLDLPLGVRPDGYDVWRWGGVYARNATAGSPPDAMWTSGQNWNFPPLHPAQIREQGYRHVRDYLTHHLRLARLLRIDHVMQLHRLYWIPNGMRADQGVYVRYKPQEFYAILNLESHRCQTTLIGENLGTVPPEVNQAMQQHNMQQMYVVQYEIAASSDVGGEDQPSADGGHHAEDAATPGNAAERARSTTAALHHVPAGCLASMNTHDMPTFAAWWRGIEILLRRQLGLIDVAEARRLREELEATKAGLRNWLNDKQWLNVPDAGDADVLLAMLKFISASRAAVVLVNLEDLWLETQPQNVPGTGPELPNWRRKASFSFEEFTQSADVLAALKTVAEYRQLANTERAT